MKLNEIKQMDIGIDLLEHYWPEDEDCWGSWITLSLGIKGEEGAVYYNLLVCTPDWLKKELRKSRSVWGRHMLIVNEFNPDLIRAEVDKKLSQLLQQFESDDDVVFSEKIGRYAHWEFEDFVPYKE